MNTNYTAENNSWCQRNTGNRVGNTSNRDDLTTTFSKSGFPYGSEEALR